MNTPDYRSQDSFVREFQFRGQAHRLWQHPYFRKIKANPTREALKKWALQAGRIDQVFAEILANMLKNPAILATDHPPLEENLQDELGHGKPEEEHFTLFQNVLGALEVSNEEYDVTPMTDGTQRIIESLREASLDHRDPLKILGLMASEEFICPREFPLLLEQLRRYANPKDLAYFDVHIEADAKHSEDLIRICYRTAVRIRRAVDDVFVWQDEDLENNCRFYDDLMKTLH